MFGGDGDDTLQSGPQRNHIDGGAGNDIIRFTAMHRATSTALGGAGDDIFHAYGRGPIQIDCGAGDDAVRISYNRRVSTRNCENVARRYRR
jgi:Ca2+-binding RTX toxin-like protein